MITVRIYDTDVVHTPGPGNRLYFGRGSESLAVDFQLADIPTLSRRAGHIDIEPEGLIKITCTQGQGGGVEVLSIGGGVIAQLSGGKSVVLDDQLLTVRSMVPGVTRALEILRTGPTGGPYEGNYSSDIYAITDTVPVFSREDVFTPSQGYLWKRVVALACARARYPKGIGGNASPDAQYLPKFEWLVLTCQRLFPSQNVSRTWVSRRLSEASAAYHLPNGHRQIPAIVPPLLAIRAIDERLLLELAAELEGHITP